MEKTGILNFSNNMPEVDGMRLAFSSGANVFQTARIILNTIGISEGEGVSVRGTPSHIAGKPVLFITEISKVSISAAGGSLPGPPISVPVPVTCKDCNYVNTVLWIDLNNPDECQNPNPPKHLLKVI